MKIFVSVVSMYTIFGFIRRKTFLSISLFISKGNFITNWIQEQNSNNNKLLSLAMTTNRLLSFPFEHFQYLLSRWSLIRSENCYHGIGYTLNSIAYMNIADTNARCKHIPSHKITCKIKYFVGNSNSKGC